ncbi:hypothetical protein [Profundibacterium mesophilum]|uniref:Uncharacterized protein n=1 Tax=Profundibacterium mesophilum KAUST100406-0324 TaxID=1037889 RepID=A0A921NXG6_9RHOB|nr:hypothetical protein [Profundibacterium mesophilum]KAF0677141.1 hypothetical protein PMES_00456 [Profundibacterium mesophilum KAUST100406-0324]
MDEPGRVRRRAVFYIPGYDPIPPRRYRELYRREAATQARISGYEIALAAGPAPRDASGAPRPFGWSVTSHMEGHETSARVEVLVWSDIVRHSMQGGIARTYAMMLRTAWIYISSGALWRLLRLRKGPVIAALYPVAALLGQLLAAVAIGVAAGRLASWALPGGAIGAGAGLAAGLAAGWAVLHWFRTLDHRLFAYYLMHDYAFTARWRGDIPPALRGRLAHFTDRIEAALDEDIDEVLIVGHSSGAHLGVMVLAALLRGRGTAPGGPALSFLSLGQVVPMVSFLPRAGALRADLAALSVAPGLTWVDVTAPGDGCAFALCDPVAVSGVAPPAQRWPLILSAAFSESLAPQTWKALRWRFFRLHFQYLCAFDRPRGYDYFAITAGPRSLGARFAGRVNSRSVRRAPVSPHRDMAA